MEAFGRILLIGGGLIAFIGLLFLVFGRLGLGRLPGDILIQRENFTFYFPMATMIIISIVLTLIFNFLRR
ncbi:MAG: DUF2905 domain-containing protein [Bacillota bacterium]